MKTIEIMILFAFLSSCRMYSQENNSLVNNLSIYELIVNPEKYNLEKIAVSGFLEYNGRGHALLFCTADDLKFSVHSNAVFITLYEEELIALAKKWDGKHITLYGTFYSDRKGYLGFTESTISDVQSIIKSEVYSKKK